MVRHLYTLHKLAEELRKIRSCRIIECFSQDRDTAIITLYDGTEKIHLNFSAVPGICSLYLRHNFSRAHRNSVDLFPLLMGQTIKSILSHDSDRILTIATNDYKIVFILFGGSKSNLLVIDSNNLIIDCFKNKSKLIGTIFNIPEVQLSKTIGTEEPINYFTKHYPYLGKYYASEFLTRRGSGTLPHESLIEVAEKFRDKILQSNKCFLLKRNGEYLFSLIELSGWDVVDSFDSISTGIEKRIRKELAEGAIGGRRSKLLSRLGAIQAKTLRTINEIEDDSNKTDRIGKYREWAELLINCPDQKEKPGDSISLVNWSGQQVDIPLKPNLTINENAGQYFAKSKNGEANIKIRKAQLSSLKQKSDRISNLLLQINTADTVRKLDKLAEENIDIFGDETHASAGSKFRVFDLGEGYTLYVGKNAANNDELTVRFAKPNDLWLHARGTSGSHAVLRLNKDEKPPKHILKKAASVAAYYSGAKNAKYVPVCYTLKKYVNKPRGANPGSVTLSREDVIMVEPSLPQENKN